MQNSDKLDLIIDILKRHEKQFDQIDKRFDLIDQRFEQVDKKFDQVEKRLDRIEEENRNKFNSIETDMRWIRDKILELWEYRKEVKVSFSRGWAWQNMIYSGGISIMVFIIGFFLFIK